MESNGERGKDKKQKAKGKGQCNEVVCYGYFLKKLSPFRY